MLMEKFKKDDVTNYTKSEAVFEDGDWWYKSPSGYRQRVSTHAAKNTNRMFVNGKYIPSSHPLHKPGRYKSLDDAKHVRIQAMIIKNFCSKKSFHRNF